jgi:hypothetical protein
VIGSTVSYAATNVQFGLPDPTEQSYAYGYSTTPPFVDTTSPGSTQATLRANSIVSTRTATLGPLFLVAYSQGGCGSSADATFTVWHQAGCAAEFVPTDLAVSFVLSAAGTATGYCANNTTDTITVAPSDRFALVSESPLACSTNVLNLSATLGYT